MIEGAQNTNLNIMKSIIKEIGFDEDLVKRMKEQKTSKDVLYKYLVEGKITMKEYLAAL